MGTKLMPNLMVENINEAGAFYAEALGFRFTAGVRVGSQKMVNALQDDVELQ